MVLEPLSRVRVASPLERSLLVLLASWVSRATGDRGLGISYG